MFWSDWGEKPRIVRASMDGTGRRNVITTDVKWPNGLAVDYKDPRLFWLDAHKDYSRLESSNLDGKNRKKLISNSLSHPFAITIYGDQVFWTDWERLSIESCNKKTGNGKWLVKDKIKNVMDLRAFEAERQPDGMYIVAQITQFEYKICVFGPSNNLVHRAIVEWLWSHQSQTLSLQLCVKAYRGFGRNLTGF